MNFDDNGGRCARTLAFAALVGLAGAGLSGCGDTGPTDESVFLYFFNGNPTSASMDVFGPTGSLANNVRFGQRVGPVEFDRSQGSQMTLLVDGIPSEVQVAKELFALYPQETATLVLKRRSGVNSVNTQMFRHLQLNSRACNFAFGNALSVTDSLNADELYSFSVYPQFQATVSTATAYPRNRPSGISDPVRPSIGARNIETAYFQDDAGVIETECGPLDNPFPRAGLFQNIQNNGWLWPVEFQAEAGAGGNITNTPEFKFVFGTNLQAGGQIQTIPTTGEYLDCLAGALSVKQDEMNPVIQPNAGANCPDSGALQLSDFDVDRQVVQECQRQINTESVTEIPVGGNDDFLLMRMQPDILEADQSNCTFAYRFLGPGGTIFEGGHRPSESAPDPSIVATDSDFAAGDVSYLFLYGRPINPNIFQWRTIGSTVILSRDNYPYPDAPDPRQDL